MITKAEGFKVLARANTDNTPGEVLSQFFHHTAWQNLTDSAIVFDDGSVANIDGVNVQLWDDMNIKLRAKLYQTDAVKWHNQ